MTKLKQSGKPLNPKQEAPEVRILKDDELECVSGGSMVSNVIKGFGDAVRSAASKG